MSINKRLFNILQELGISNTDLAKGTGIKANTISDWKTKGTNPSSDKIYRICEFLNISTDYLLEGIEPKYRVIHNKKNCYKVTESTILEAFNMLSYKYKERILERIQTYLEEDEQSLIKEDYENKYIIKNNTSNIKYIPNLGLTSAGEPLLLPDDYTTSDLIPMPESTKADFALTVKGNSMEPDILNGSTIYIKQKPSVENGSIAIVALDDTVTCKKFYKINDNIELRSINPNYDPIIITPNNNINFRIIGEVVNS